jgi:hypothetical protein
MVRGRGFLAAGPKVSRHGGITLAKLIEIDKLDKILARDPFPEQKLAHQEMTEFNAVRLAPEID